MDSHRNERELIEQAVAGDESALERLMLMHHSRLAADLGRKLPANVRGFISVEDVLQETMVALAKSVTKFRGDASLSTWLYSVARHSCIKKRRTGKYEPKHNDSLDESALSIESCELAPDQQLEREQLWQQVQTAIAGLDQGHREVLLLRDVEGLSAKEVAEILGLGEAAIKSRLHRARKQLREELAPKIARQCPSLQETLSQYLDGELSATVCCQMQSPLDSCSECETDLRELQDTLRICKQAPPGRVPEDVAGRVQKALREVLAR